MKKARIIIPLFFTMLLCLIIVFLRIVHIQEDTITRFFTIRYDNLNKDNYYSRIEIQKKMCEDSFVDNSWIFNQIYIDETYSIISEDNIETLIIDFDICKIGEEEFDVNIKVLYNTEIPQNRYYVDYYFHVYIGFNVLFCKIKNADMIKNTPTFPKN